MAAEPVASAATEAVAKGIALGGYFDILLDVVKATPALVLASVKKLLTNPTSFVTDYGQLLERIPAILIFIGHATATFASVAPEDKGKGGKPISWLKTLVLGYLIVQGGVDLSVWLIGGKPDTWYGWEYATVIAVIWYASTFTPVINTIFGFELLRIPVFKVFCVAMVELYCAQGIRDIAEGAASVYGAASWATIVVLPIINNFGGVFLREFYDKDSSDASTEKPPLDLYFYVSHAVLFPALCIWTNTLSSEQAFGLIVLSMTLRSALATIGYNVDWTPFAASLSHTLSQVPDVSGLPSFLPAPVVEILALPGKLLAQLSGPAPKDAKAKAH